MRSFLCFLCNIAGLIKAICITEKCFFFLFCSSSIDKQQHVDFVLIFVVFLSTGFCKHSLFFSLSWSQTATKHAAPLKVQTTVLLIKKTWQSFCVPCSGAEWTDRLQEMRYTARCWANKKQISLVLFLQWLNILIKVQNISIQPMFLSINNTL